MTNWLPDTSSLEGPRYVAIADALARDIAAGDLPPGTRLPTHRDLAWRLGVTVGTVSRAYAEAERRGFVTGEVGRGTFIRGSPLAEATLPPIPSEDRGAPALIDLSYNFPPPTVEDGALGATLRAMGDDPHATTLLPYQPSAGRRAHREAAAVWLGRHGLGVAPDEVVITNGAQHAIAVVLASLTRPGDRIAAEAFTYPVVKLTAQMLGLRVTGIAMDEHGIRPEAFAAACRAGGLKALYCVPTLHNPTTGTLSEDRRAALVEVARAHGVALIEDDLMRLMGEGAPPPLAALAPERTYYITSLSKTVAPGLRVGFVAAPRQAVERLAEVVRATGWMTTPLGVEVAARWITDGTAERILTARRREVEARRLKVRAAFRGYTAACAPGSMNAWLQLPEPWTANAFAQAARDRGVVLTPAEAFAIDRRDRTPAVRICFGSAPDHARLDAALAILTDLLERPTTGALPAIV